MKLIKNILLIFLLVFITSVTALWAVTYFVQPDTFKRLARQQLSSLTQQDSAIEGNINWRIFPRPGLHLTKVRIGDVNKTNSDYALTVDNLLFHLQIAPLLRGKLVFDKLMLDGFTLRINLNDATPTPTPEKKQAAPKASKITLPARIALKSLLLTNGKIILNQKKEQLLLKHVRLEAELPQSNQEPFPIQLKAALKKQPGSFPLNGTLSYKGLLKLPPLNTINTQLENLELDGQITIQNLQAGEYAITEANAHTFFRQGNLELNPLTLSLYNGESVGQLSYQLKTSQLKFNQTGTGLNAEPVFQHVLDVRPSRLTGLLDFSVHATTTLNSPDWHKKMNLNGNFTLHNGTVAYLNLPAIRKEATDTLHALTSQGIDSIQSTLEHLKPWHLNDYSGSTNFQLLNLQYQTKGDGNLDYTLLLETKKLNLKGNGTLNLETEAINAHLMAHVITKDKTTQAVQELLGRGFPLLVTGTLSNPMINADRRLIRHVISNSVLPTTLIKPLKKLNKHIKKLNHAPSSHPITE
ncbi:MAG: AsmA family protein [Gammaproteobacteria bacterium]|nr:AsmA family protein [Gammaproteobacteria bacterium]